MKKRTFRIVAACMWLLLAATFLQAAPAPGIGPLDVEGMVVDLKWLPEQQVKGIPGMSGTAGHDRVIPARFMATLRDYSGIDPNTIQMMKMVYSWSVPDNRGKDGTPATIVLRLDHPDRQFLKKGVKIRVKGYTMRGDEGGDWISYKEITILP